MRKFQELLQRSKPTPERVRIANFEIEVEETREDEFFVLTARGLNVSAFGQSFEEAQIQFLAAMDSYIHALCQNGDLETVFSHHNIHLVIEDKLKFPETCHSVDLHEANTRIYTGGRAILPAFA